MRFSCDGTVGNDDAFSDFFGDAGGDRLGQAISYAGDVTGDGTADFGSGFEVACNLENGAVYVLQDRRHSRVVERLQGQMLPLPVPVGNDLDLQWVVGLRCSVVSVEISTMMVRMTLIVLVAIPMQSLKISQMLEHWVAYVFYGPLTSGLTSQDADS